MNKSDILMAQACKTIININHVCITENGIEPDEKFTITDIIGDFEQIVIKNQYSQTIIINPNQLS